MPYVCVSCKREYGDDELEFVRCAYCGSKVLFKKTPPTAKVVKTD
jgi:DNA-directed RNA polymerase subunit RPC12/RpoP